MIQLDVLRHGECRGGEIFRGGTDVALSDTGWRQMREATLRKAGPWQRIVSSPLQRCRSFGETLAAELDLPLEIDDDWREMSFGDWEGRARDEIFAHEGPTVAGFYRDPVNCAPPGGESADSLQRRVVAAYRRVLAQSSGDRVLIISHGGVIRTLLAHVLGMPLQRMYTLDVPYACISGLHHVERENYSRLLYHNS